MRSVHELEDKLESYLSEEKYIIQHWWWIEWVTFDVIMRYTIFHMKSSVWCFDDGKQVSLQYKNGERVAYSYWRAETRPKMLESIIETIKRQRKVMTGSLRPTTGLFYLMAWNREDWDGFEKLLRSRSKEYFYGKDKGWLGSYFQFWHPRQADIGCCCDFMISTRMGGICMVLWCIPLLNDTPSLRRLFWLWGRWSTSLGGIMAVTRRAV